MVTYESQLIDRLIKRLEDKYSRKNLRKTFIILGFKSNLDKLEFLNSCFTCPTARSLDEMKPEEKREPLSWYPYRDRDLCGEMYYQILVERAKRNEKEAIKKKEIIDSKYKAWKIASERDPELTIEEFMWGNGEEKKKSFNEKDNDDDDEGK